MQRARLSNTTATTEFIPNNCTQEGDRLDPVFMAYYFGMFGLVMLVNLTGNWLVMKTFYRHKCLRLPSNAFICSLALSDFLFGIVYPVYNVAGINTSAVRSVLGKNLSFPLRYFSGRT